MLVKEVDQCRIAQLLPAQDFHYLNRPLSHMKTKSSALPAMDRGAF
jgi:hypothetical protein